MATVTAGHGVRSTSETFRTTLSGKRTQWMCGNESKTIRLPRKNVAAKLGIRAGKYRQLLRVFMERANGDTALLKKTNRQTIKTLHLR